MSKTVHGVCESEIISSCFQRLVRNFWGVLARSREKNGGQDSRGVVEDSKRRRLNQGHGMKWPRLQLASLLFSDDAVLIELRIPQK